MTDRVGGPAVGLSVVLTPLVVLGVGAYAGQVEATALACLAGGLLGLACVVLGRRDVPGQVASSLLFVAAAVVAIVAATLAIRTVAYDLGRLSTAGPIVELGWQSILLVLAGTVATFGATVLPFRPGRGPGVQDLASTAIVATAVVGAFLVAFASDAGLGTIGAWWGDALGSAFDAVVDPGDVAAPGTFSLLVGAAALAIGRLFARLPLAEFVERERRRSVHVRVERWSDRCTVAGAVALLVGLLFVPVPDAAWRTLSPSTALYDLLVGVTSSGALRTALLYVAVAALVGVGAMTAIERGRRATIDEPATVLGQGLGGVAVVLVLLVVGPDAIVDVAVDVLPADGANFVEATVDETSATVFVVGATFAASAILSLLLGGLAVALWAGLLARRSAAATLAGAGVAAATLSAGMVAGPSAVLLAATAAAVLVWEFGTYGGRLHEEVGAGAPTRRAELVHVGALVPVAAVVAIGVTGGSSILSGSSLERPAVAVAAVLAVLLLAVAIRD